MRANFLDRFLVLVLFGSLLIYGVFRNSDWFQDMPLPIPEIIRLPLPIKTYRPPEIKSTGAYTVLVVGDSMVAALGPNFDSLRFKLKSSFPEKEFGLFNYGVPSSNVLSLESRLTQDTQLSLGSQPPILGREFEVIIIESFGHNPLSEFNLEEGLSRQTQALDKVVAQLAFHRHNSLIVFMTPIAPSKTKYALQSRELSAEERRRWAEERIAYIENHRQYAIDHSIPLIDVYSRSLDQSGEADLQFINSDDYIHPSAAGVDLMSQLIADYLASVLPH